MKKHIETAKRYVRKKRVITLIVVAFFILTFFLFRNSFLGFGLEVFINSKLQTDKGIKCKFEKMRIESNSLVFTHFQASSDKMPHADLEIDKLRVSLRFNLREFEIDPIIEIDKPKLTLTRPLPNEEKAGAPPFEFFRAITRHIQLNVNGGELLLKGENSTTPFFFSFKSDFENECFGILTLAKSPNDFHSPMMEVSVSSLSSELFSYFDFNHLELPLLDKLNQYFSFIDNGNWSASGGVLTGNTQLHFDSKGNIKRGDVQIELENLEMENSELQSKLSLHSANWRISFPLARNKETAIHKSWVDLALRANLDRFHFKVDEHTDLYLNGKLSLNIPESTGINLNGQLNIDGVDSDIVIRGNPYYGQKEHPEFGLKLDICNAKDGLSSIDCSIKNIKPHHTQFRGVCTKLDVEHLNLIQKMVAPHIPDVAKLDMKEGKFECAVVAQVHNRKVKTIQVEKIIAKNLHAQFDKGKLIAFCSRLEGALEIDLATKKVDTWKIDVESGDLVIAPENGGDNIMLYELNAQVASQLGTYSHSNVKGRLYDHQFDLTFYGLSQSPDVRLKLNTSTSAIAKHMDKREFAPLPPEVQYNISANFYRESDHWKVKGELAGANPLTFGFKLTDFPLKKSLKEQMTQMQHHIYAGWFKGRSIGADKYGWITHLVDAEWGLQGSVDVIGRFDGSKVKCDFTSEEVAFLSNEIDIHIEEKNRKRVGGSLTFKYEDESLDLHIPVQFADCHIKEMDLMCHNLSGDLYIRDGKLFIHQLAGESNGMKMAGQIDLKFDNGKPSYLEVNINKMKGTAQSLKLLAQHFPDFKSLSAEFKGDVEARGKGFVLKSELGKETLNPNWNFAFHISEGESVFNEQTKLVGFSSDVAFSSNNEAYSLYNMHGQFEIDGKLTSNYIFGKQIDVNYNGEGSLKFDISLENEMLTLLHFVGESQVREDKLYDLQVDPKQSHFLGSSLEFSNFIVTERFEPKGGSLQFDLDGKDLVTFGDLLSKFDVLPSAKELFSKRVKCHSFIQFDIEFDKDVDGWKVDLQSRETTIGPIHSSPLHLNVKKMGSEIEVVKGSFGIFQFSGKSKLKEGKYINCGGQLAFDNSLFSFHDGIIDPKGSLVRAKYKSENLKLEELKQLTLFKENIQWHDHEDLVGQIVVSGDVSLSEKHIESQIHLNCNDFGKNGFILTSQNPLKLHWDDEEIRLSNLDLNLTHPNLPNHFFGFCASELSYKEKKSAIKEAEVTLSPEMIAYLIKTKSFEPFDGLLHSLQENLDNIGYTKLVQFKANLDWDGPHFKIDGMLKNGIYHIKNREFNLKRPHFTYDGKEITLSSLAQFEDRWIDCKARLEMNENRRFDVELKGESTQNASCILKGSISAEDEIICDTIEGEIYGVKLNFSSRYSHIPGTNEIVLGGEIVLDCNDMVQYLPEYLQEKLKGLHINRPLKLEGNVVLNKEKLEKSYFKGYLKGRDLQVSDFEIRNLLSSFYMTKDKLECRDFSISDQAGHILVKEIDINREKSNFSFEMKDIEVTELRPSLIRKMGEEPSKVKPFVMRKLKMAQLTGNFDDLNSIKGGGTLNFLNTFKSDHKLKLIPLELITRLGLDLGLLVPIRGDIDFQIRNKRIELNQLRNSFSEGKRSHFFFPSQQACYIDFNGDIHVDVKMKQYVLFKLTQPFTISLRGNVAKPKYGLK
ncbi:MAG: hypothetical protein P0S95_02025 [Rhabdochlamydiaceae bacterium]|nr:hypothetical protein [Candidatus Amphrikana amoebophyrae]